MLKIKYGDERRLTSTASCVYYRTRTLCECQIYIPPRDDEDDAVRDIEPDPNFVIRDNEFSQEEHNLRVERHERALQVSLKVVEKTMNVKCCQFNILEYWGRLRGEKIIEDHEYLLLATRGYQESYRKKYKISYTLQARPAKYEMLHNPEEFFPPKMLLDKDLDPVTNLASDNTLDAICRSASCPTVYVKAFKLYKPDAWRMVYIAVIRGTVCYSKYKLLLCRYLLARTLMGDDVGDNDFGVVRFTDMKNCHIFSVFCSNFSSAPSKHIFYLRTTENIKEKKRIFAMETLDERDYIVGALRLAKYGRHLLSNYLALRKEIRKEKVYVSQFRTKRDFDYVDFSKPLQTQVKEKKLPRHEYYIWMHISYELDKKTRGWAEAYIMSQGRVDGAFLVRELHGNGPWHYVLSYYYQGTVYHAPIIPKLDKHMKVFVFSLDQRTEFYDIVQLVEYYLLNAGSLKTNLTVPA